MLRLQNTLPNYACVKRALQRQSCRFLSLTICLQLYIEACFTESKQCGTWWVATVSSLHIQSARTIKPGCVLFPYFWWSEGSDECVQRHLGQWCRLGMRWWEGGWEIMLSLLQKEWKGWRSSFEKLVTYQAGAMVPRDQPDKGWQTSKTDSITKHQREAAWVPVHGSGLVTPSNVLFIDS